MAGDATIRFARVDFRNDNRVFGLKAEDRFSHTYITGKPGCEPQHTPHSMPLG